MALLCEPFAVVLSAGRALRKSPVRPAARRRAKLPPVATVSPTEAAQERAQPASARARQLAALLFLVLLLHLPFLGRGVNTDDVIYLDLAENALRRPLTPHDLPYLFHGKRVDMAGHPHPPLNAYLLAALWAVRGSFSERFFHAAYLVFPVAVALAMYFLAMRFTCRPWPAAAIFATAPVVQVVSHSLESDSPTLAFGLVGITLFVYGVDQRNRGKLLAGAAALSLAGLGALQSLFLLPAAALYLWMHRPAERSARLWAAAACALPLAVLCGWQLLQFALLGRLPAAVLAGYIVNRGYLGATLKLLNFVALTQHAAVLAVFLPVLLVLLWRHLPRGGALLPLLAAAFGAWRLEGYRGFERAMFFVFFAAGLMLLAAMLRLAFSGGTGPSSPNAGRGDGNGRDTRFLAAWFLLYFAACLAAFFAGAARYLLLGLPALVLLCVRLLEDRPALRRKALAWLAIGGNLALGLALAHADYQFAKIHRAFAGDFRREFASSGERFLFNGEWGFRHYMKTLGGEILWERSGAHPGRLLVSSRLALGGEHNSPAEEAAVPIATRRLYVSSPLRIVDAFGGGPDEPPGRAGFLSVVFGVLPFSFSRGPLDEIRIARVSPLLAVLDRVQTQPQGAQVMLTQIAFPDGRRLVLRQPPGSAVRIPIPAEWKRLRGALFARGPGAAEFSLQLQTETLMTARVSLDAQKLAADVAGTAWVPFDVELPLHAAGAPLTLRIEAPAQMTVGWGGVLVE